MRKRKQVFAAKEKTTEELKGYATLNMKAINSGEGVKAVTSKEPVLTGGFWSDEDLSELIRLVKKYPNGTLSRWDIIANQMNRSVQEVTFMAARLKDGGYRLPNDSGASVAEIIVKETKTKAKQTLDPNVEQKNIASDAFWSQDQQKLLEMAIVKCPKNTSGDRWQKIANTVPGKTKEECLARYKFLVEKVKALKAAKETENVIENEPIGTDVTNNEIENSEDKENDVNDNDVPTANKTGGKPRNKRKERKKRMEFSSDEDNNESDNDFQ